MPRDCIFKLLLSSSVIELLDGLEDFKYNDDLEKSFYSEGSQ